MFGSTPKRPVAAAASCPTCGTEFTPGLPYCPGCGSRTDCVTGSINCRKCGESVGPTAKFCAECGYGLGPGARGERRTSALHAPVVDTGVKLIRLDEAGTQLSSHPLAGERTTIGREDADITFSDDPYLSPQHAELIFRDDVLCLRDLGSRNGTWYFIEEPHRLTDGEHIYIGSQILLFRRLGYPGPNPPEADATRRLGSLSPSADIANFDAL